jgi:cation diffusion facilitator family transporter
MHTHSIEPWTHQHFFLGQHHARNEARTWAVVGITAAMMVGEIVGGTLFGSMALLADGWHMSTHAAALRVAGWAHVYARRHVNDPRFAFGTGKVGELAGFTSAVVLAIIAVLIAYESVLRLLNPVAIAYVEATAIAALGLVVNVVSAWLLSGGHDHHHHHDHNDVDHDHERHDHHHRDLNLRAAYLHVIADAATSVLAIVSLGMGWAFGWSAVDPIVGIVGACVIASWSLTLIRDAALVLLDRVPSNGLAQGITTRLETGGDRISDLHIWRVGPGHCAAIVSLVTDQPKDPSTYKHRLQNLRGLSHLTVEVQRCVDHHSARAA